ncbi:hypothetical protein H5410_042707 [Solanum commersonii]|uniref:Uncharacterized protein n=1 Tax=Solanum commersonii TaxID=4109 RepID=A0A9J5XVH3_SOLCO|nr:hypothetical protein H5410_042707 [Solanum commersonii]
MDHIIEDTNHLRANLGVEWSAICNACEINIEQRVFRAIKWNKPPPPSPHIRGEVVRDNEEIIICAYSIPLGPGTSNMAEVLQCYLA